MQFTWRRILAVSALWCCCAPSLPAAIYTLTTLASFDDANGGGPLSDLLADSAGNLYGTTYEGGSSGLGTVFKLNRATSTLTTLASFHGANGASPWAGLIADSAGNLYGTTSDGGASGRGTVFKLETATSALTTLASFDGGNGDTSWAGLIADSTGSFLYGTAVRGGALDRGVVFKLDLTTSALTTVASFDGTRGSGANPLAALTADSVGNFYGTTSGGGASGRGSIFKLDMATRTLSTIASFNGTNGNLPAAELIADSVGNLYGTTSEGGARRLGTVFKFDPAAGAITTLVSFYGANGSYPRGPLISDSAGNLYGTTSEGGSSALGTVFKIDPTTTTLTTLTSFNGINGAYPFAGLSADSVGNLYGTTAGGGASGRGTVFRLSIIVPEPGALAIAATALSLAVGRWRWR